MRFAIDIMGGDHAPAEIIAGVQAAAARYPERQYILVGDQAVIEALGALPANIHAVFSQSVMGMDEPVDNIRSKRDSSIWVSTKLVKDGQADAIISAGSTGAQMAAATLLLGRIKGIARPAIVGIVPSPQGEKLFLDMGANIVCTPDMLYQFAQMGCVYARELLDIANPRVALLSNGSEAHKGTDLVQAAYALLSQSNLNFIGNREGRDITAGNYDVLVCDGFSGNIALKTLEGTAMTIFGLLKEELQASLLRKLGAALIMPGLRNIKKRLDSNEQGGAPLLGVQGVSIICHGSSKAKAITNALETAAACVQRDFVGKIAAAVQPEEKEN